LGLNGSLHFKRIKVLSRHQELIALKPAAAATPARAWRHENAVAVSVGKNVLILFAVSFDGRAF
jgi:hypothetical protein